MRHLKAIAWLFVIGMMLASCSDSSNGSDTGDGNRIDSGNGNGTGDGNGTDNGNGTDDGNATNLEECSSEGEIKYTCSNFSEQWKCTKQTNGTYWVIENEEYCSHGCGEDGKCFKYPGEGEDCTYNSCTNDNKILLECVDGKAHAYDCIEYRSGDVINGDPMRVCISYEDGTGAICDWPKEDDYWEHKTCSEEGYIKITCITEDDFYYYRVAFECKKLSDGSMRYIKIKLPESEGEEEEIKCGPIIN